MKRTKILAVIFLTAFLSFGQEVEQNAEQKPNISIEPAGAGSNTTTNTQKKVQNRRYIVVSAVMMMLFIGLAMGSVSSLNPD